MLLSTTTATALHECAAGHIDRLGNYKKYLYVPGEALCQSKHTEAVSLIIYPQASGLRQRAADLSTVVYHCTTAACAKRHLVMRLLCRDHVHDTVH